MKRELRSGPSERYSVVLVEDEPQLRGLLKENLEFEGHTVVAVGSAEDALAQICESAPPSLLVLDVMLPKMSGFELCRAVRQKGISIPIIMLTARGSESDRVVGLDLGADDYVTKPFSVLELMARVRAQLRRGSDERTNGSTVVFGDVRVDTKARSVTRRGKRVRLSSREFELLFYLLSHRREIVSREQLLRDVWGYSGQSMTRTVDNFIAKLRMHLEPRPHEPRYIISVHGSGYQMLI